MKYHFISGLPRAGSTLLASLLRQNPVVHASIMSPVGHVITSTLAGMGPSNEAQAFFSDKCRAKILRGIFDHYYEDAGCPIVFDNNRRWTANIALLANLYPDCRVLCCVRPPVEVADSFEQLFQSRPLTLSAVYGSKPQSTVYDRINEIMQPMGVLGFALAGLRSAFFGPHRDRLMLVSYDTLVRSPALTMRSIERELRLPPFVYDFDHVLPIPGAAEFDRSISTPGLHDLRPSVDYIPPSISLPPELVATLPLPFWVKGSVTAAK